MKMVKSLLLGSAAGLVAVATAQAADLPVKAKPVQYVKICSLYGPGFYYMPGTDICLKVGGWVRAEYAYGDNGNMTTGILSGQGNTRLTSNSTWRHRGYITADARNQSAYGTVRGYIAIGLSTNSTGLDNAANQFSSNRAFVQWAGFTAGLATSFFDFYNVPATSYWGTFPGSDTGDPGWGVLAYTAQFGGGFSATISAEQRRLTQIVNANGAGAANAGTVAPGGFLGGVTYGNNVFAGGLSANTSGGLITGAGAYGGFQSPDIVANVRLDQAWGGAQIMGALHQVNSGYYLGSGYQTGAGGGAAIAAAGGSSAAPVVGSGHASDVWGYVVGAGIKLNAPMIGPGDYLQAQINYASGATGYIFQTTKFNYGGVKGSQEGFGVLTDAVIGGSATGGNGTSNELTKSWNFNAAYEHFWNPAWRTSVYGGYAAVRYSDLANNLLCAVENNTINNGVNTPAIAGCSNNWSTYWIGTRTQWNITKDFYMGLDVLYTKLNSANAAGASGLGVTATPGSIGAQSLGISGSSASNTAQGGVTNVDNYAVRLRIHRDFLP